YANITQNFYQFVFQHQLDQYTLQRIVPAGIVFTFYKLFHLPIEYTKIPFAFCIYNFVLLIFAVYMWREIAKLSHWSTKTFLLGFTGIFLNYAQLKWLPYYPVLTDTTALVIGVATLYCYVLKRKDLILIIGIVAAFAFPTQFFVNAILFIFSNAN